MSKVTDFFNCPYCGVRHELTITPNNDSNPQLFYCLNDSDLGCEQDFVVYYKLTINIDARRIKGAISYTNKGADDE